VIQTRQRERVIKNLDRENIGWLIHYPTPPHLQGAYRCLRIDPGSLPVCERLADEVLSIPMSPHLTESEVDCVVNAIVMMAEA
jgi:dTDP-4-amino-4,6-dideoxygalactose transaminase